MQIAVQHAEIRKLVDGKGWNDPGRPEKVIGMCQKRSQTHRGEALVESRPYIVWRRPGCPATAHKNPAIQPLISLPDKAKAKPKAQEKIMAKRVIGARL